MKRPILSRDCFQLLITAALCSPGVGACLIGAGVLLLILAQVVR